MDSARLVLMEEWNTVLNPKMDRGQRASGVNYRSLVDLIGKFDVFDRWSATLIE